MTGVFHRGAFKTLYENGIFIKAHAPHLILEQIMPEKASFIMDRFYYLEARNGQISYT